MSDIPSPTIEEPAASRLSLSITRIRATPVSVPLSFAYEWAPGSYAGFTRTLVEVETSEGVTGIGEAGSPRDAAVINELLAPSLVGADPLNHAECERRALPSIAGMTTVRDFSRLSAYSGIELALWDIAGKVSGRSVADLLGGRVRAEVAVAEYFALETGSEQDFASVADRCAQAIADRGANLFEGKVGVLPLREESRYVSAVRDAIGDEIPIRLDANMAWDVATAKQAIRRYAELGVTWIEEPVLTQAELGRLGPAGDISFSSHQLDLPAAARDGVPHAFVVMLHYLGGIRRTVDFVRACAIFGVRVWFRAPNTGVATAAELQIAAALAPIDQPSQNLGHWVTDDVIERGPFRAANGVIPVPDGPGLGVALDATAVERCAERAASAPMHDPYGRW